jgi:GT2 family glycosyltransferase
MAVYSTTENGKDEYLEKTLYSLEKTVDFTKHRLILSVNAKTAKTDFIISLFIAKGVISDVIYNDFNIGTAEAINQAWKKRLAGENAVKMDDDVVIHSNDWLYLMEEAIRRDPKIGQAGLKRRDCIESPWNPDPFYNSKLRMLPHEPGQKWIVVEEVSHVMGTCVMHSSALLDKVGYLFQPGVYGFDDSFMSLRSQLAGFKNVFISAVDIEHIDRGDTGFQKWKEQKATEKWQAYITTHREFSSGKRSLYYNPFHDLSMISCL